MIWFCITNSLLVDACHVVMHLYPDDRIQLLPVFIGFQWLTEQCFLFVFRKGTWNVLSRSKTHYTVIHWSIMCSSCNLCDSHSLLSTVGIFASLPFPCEFLMFVHEMPNLFVTAKHCVFLLTGTFLSPFLPTWSGHKFVLQYSLQW